MIREMLAHFPYTALPITGQFIFLGVFVGVVIWTFRRNSTKYYDKFAALPFEGESDERN